MQARSLPTASLRPLFLAFNAVVYAVQIALWVLTGLAQSSSTHNLLRVASCGFLAIVSICAAVGFLVYGGRLFLMLRRCAHRTNKAALSLSIQLIIHVGGRTADQTDDRLNSDDIPDCLMHYTRLLLAFLVIEKTNPHGEGLRMLECGVGRLLCGDYSCLS
jgi:hypothetical protein